MTVDGLMSPTLLCLLTGDFSWCDPGDCHSVQPDRLLVWGVLATAWEAIYHSLTNYILC